uniref:Uncharacterized protein n=1 Tax=Pfiesteria piscicida TaxID=71001 RepID=E8Z6B2_PFIPI|nr:unknown [Pfiesteria piscicida]
MGRCTVSGTLHTRLLSGDHEQAHQNVLHRPIQLLEHHCERFFCGQVVVSSMDINSKGRSTVERITGSGTLIQSTSALRGAHLKTTPVM